MFRKLTLASVVAASLACPADALAWGHGGGFGGELSLGAFEIAAPVIKRQLLAVTHREAGIEGPKRSVTSTTSPASGAKTPDAAFTDSTSAAPAPFAS
jgi:hypothetical protein